MAITIIKTKSDVPSGNVWLLAVLDDTSDDILPPVNYFCTDRQHVAAMKYAFQTTGVISLNEITPTSVESINFAGLESGEKSLLVKF